MSACIVGRPEDPNPEDRPKCGRLAVGSSRYCRKHDPGRLTDVVEKQQRDAHILSTVATSALVAELRRRGAR